MLGKNVEDWDCSSGKRNVSIFSTSYCPYLHIEFCQQEVELDLVGLERPSSLTTVSSASSWAKTVCSAPSVGTCKLSLAHRADSGKKQDKPRFLFNTSTNQAASTPVSRRSTTKRRNDGLKLARSRCDQPGTAVNKYDPPEPGSGRNTKECWPATKCEMRSPPDPGMILAFGTRVKQHEHIVTPV